MNPLKKFTCLALLLSANAFAAVGDVGVYISPVRTFSTASYWIEGEEKLVMIDAQFLPKEAVAAVDLAERSTGKKVSTMIVLHPNPDKFNGTAELQRRGIRVVTSSQVAALIPAVHDIRWDWFGAEYAPDYPRVAARPDGSFEQTQSVVVDGVPLTLHVLGRGASGAHVVVQYRNAVFVGDLVNPQNHAWLELGLIGEWLARLDEIRAMKPSAVYPGRGAHGGVELIDRQASYLTRVRDIVRDSMSAGELGAFTKLRLQWKIESEFPALGYPIFMRDGLSAIWKTEQASLASTRK